MKKSLLYFVLGWIICLVVFNLAAFALARETLGSAAVFWTGYIIITAAVLGQLICAVIKTRMFPDQNDRFNKALNLSCTGGLVAITLLGVLTMLIPSFSILTGAFLCLAVLCVTVILLMVSGFHAKAEFDFEVEDNRKAFSLEPLAADAERLLAGLSVTENQAGHADDQAGRTGDQAAHADDQVGRTGDQAAHADDQAGRTGDQAAHAAQAGNAAHAAQAGNAAHAGNAGHAAHAPKSSDDMVKELVRVCNALKSSKSSSDPAVIEMNTAIRAAYWEFETAVKRSDLASARRYADDLVRLTEERNNVIEGLDA